MPCFTIRWPWSFVLAVTAVASVDLRGEDLSRPPLADGSKDSACKAASGLFVGEAYPFGAIVIQRRSQTGDGAWPREVSYLPLERPIGGALPRVEKAAYRDSLTAIYVPEWAGMPEIEKSECTPASYRATVGRAYQQGLKLVDWFDRGMRDNCERDEHLATYAVAPAPAFAFPVLAWRSEIGLAAVPDYNVAGKPRPLTAKEMAQVEVYRTDFRRDYKKAFGVEFDESSSNIGPIPTLADARMLVDIGLTSSGCHLRVSTWERISIAQHIYRVLIVDVMKGTHLVRIEEFARAQGVLG